MLRLAGVVLVLSAMLWGALAARAEQPPLQAPQLRIEAGMHTAMIQRVAISADGRLLATGAYDKTARLWSLPDGRLLRTFRLPIAPGYGGKVYAVALSPDGRRLAASGYDAYYQANGGAFYVYLFDTVSGALLRRFGPMPEVTNDLAFSPDGRLLAAALWGKNGVRVWDAASGREVFADSDYGDSAYGVAFAPDGRMATTSYDGHLRLYDRTMKLAAKAKTKGSRRPFDLAFSPDGLRLAVGYNDSTKVDIVSGRTLKRIRTADTRVAVNGDLGSVEWSADGATLYAAGGYYDTNYLRLVLGWSGKGEGETKSIGGAWDRITDLAAPPAGGIVIGSADPAFFVIDPAGASGAYQGPVTADMREKTGEHFRTSPDATQVRFGLRVRSEEPWLFDLGRLAFDASPDGAPGLLAPNTTGLPVTHWMNETRPLLGTLPLALDADELARSLAVAPDGRSFVIGADWSLTRFDAWGKQLWKMAAEGTAWGVNLSGDGEIAVAAMGDGTIRWFRTSDGTELLAFFVHKPDKRWIAWTPRGYYAASPGGEDLIGWHVNGRSWDDVPEFFPVSRFRQQFYRPDIVQQVLKTRDEAKAIEAANAASGDRAVEGSIATLLPAIVEFAEDARELSTGSRDIDVHYRLRSPSGRDITRIELRIDGRPVTPRGAMPIDEEGAVETLSLTVPPRDSEVTLVAYIGDQPSVPASIAVKWTGTREDAKKTTLYALLIGVSFYADPDLKLSYASKDARDLAAALKVQEGLFYDKVEAATLLDSDATEDSIQTELARLRKKAGPDDTVIVFMAGHGVTDEARDFYFLPAAADASPERLAATAIDGDIIRKGLARIPGKVVLFMDACHAGNGIEGGMGRVDMTGLANGLSDGASVVMFASSTGREVSYEGPQWENGAFTEALLSILADRSAYGEDGMLSISELDEQLTSRVLALTGDRQTPVMTKPGAIKRFFVAAM